MKMAPDVKRRAYQLKQRAESAEETRRRLVQAAFELHGEQGIAATTMKHIADRAGVGIGTVYHHFPTLDQTVTACGEMVMATYPPPGEEIFAGATTLRERALRLVRALFAHQDEVLLERIRPDRDLVPIVGQFIAAEEAHRVELTRAALAPFKVDRDLIRIIAALIDIAVYRGLQRAGMSLDQAAAAMADVIHARVTHKS